MRGIFQLLASSNTLRRVLVGLLATTTSNKPSQQLFTYQRTLPPLDKIPVDSAAAAAAASDGSTGPSAPATTHDYSQSIPVLYTNDLDSASQWVDQHLDSTTPTVLGWDMESSPYLPWLEKKYTRDTYFGPATIQLSTVSNSMVFQIAQDKFGPIHDNTLPSFINDILEDSSIIKTGVGIDEDMIELFRWYLDNEKGNDDGNDGSVVVPTWGATPTSTSLRRFDMGGIGAPPPEERSGRTVGLARLVAGVLGVTIPKSNALARSHWSKAPLTNREVAYAARDAWAAAAILHRLDGLDIDRFSPESLIARLDQEELRSIEHISDRSAQRKTMRTEWKELRDRTDKNTGVEKVPWTEEQRARHDFLAAEMKDLAPTPPTWYDITESLGLKIP